MAGPPPPGTPTSTTPNPPLWMPAGVPGPMAHRSMMPMLSLLLRVLGFTLLFLGALIAIAWGYPGGGCFPSPGATSNCGPGSNYVTGAANGIMAGHLLFAIGAFFLGLGAGIKIHFSLGAPTSGQKEDYRFVIADRWFNGLIVLVSVFILFSLLTSVTAVVSGLFALL